MINPIRLQPLSISDLFDAAFRLCRRHFRDLVTITAFSAVPMEILRYIFWSNVDVISFGPFDIFGIYLTGFIIDSLLTLTLGSVLSGALVRFISSAYLGEMTSPIGSYQLGIARSWRLIAGSCIPFLLKNGTRPIGLFLDSIWYGSGILFIIGSAPRQASWYSDLPALLFCFAIILALRLVVLLLYTNFALIPQVVVLENNSLLNSLKRSRRLVTGSMRRALAVVIPAEILRLMFNGMELMLIRMMPQSLFTVANTHYQTVIFGAIGVISQVLSQPLLIAIFTVFYYDLRVRNEGYDLELLARQNISA